MLKALDVAAVCNALVDIIVDATDKDVEQHQLGKGHMHLVDAQKQAEIINHFKNHIQTVELGGSAMNAMRALAGLGKKTAFAGMIGKDGFGQRIKNRMSELKIDAHLGESGSIPTGTCLILVTPDGERTMVTCLGASRLYDKTHIPTEAISNAKIFHFCGYQWDTDNQKQGILEAIQIAKREKTKISFDLADPAVVSAHREDFLKFIEKDADIIFANKEESRLLYDLPPKETARKIAEISNATVVIKLGSEGALIQSGKQSFNVPPVQTKVIDTTAAGDMFAGGFLFGLVENLSFEKCGEIAATLASDVISRYGAKLSENVLEKFKN